MRLFHLPGPEAYAMDFVINDLLVTWGMKITPYGIAHDPSMITWKDSEDLSYATLFGVHGIEPEDRKDECRAAGKCPAGDRLGAGQPDTVDEPGGGAGGDPDDDPPERPHELMRRKMQVEKCLKEKQLAMGKSGADMQMLIDRLVPSRVNWRNFVETNVKAAAGRVSTTWRRTKLRAMTVQAVLPGRQDERTGVLVLQNDTSGSVGREEKEQYAGHVVGVMRQLRPKRIIMLDTDHEVQQVREPASLDELKSMLVEHGYKGGGGTSMEAGFDWCKANDITPDCVITLTDGYTSWPRGHAPAKRALWCITTPGIKAPEGCGVSVYMPLDNP
jgi:predicted metal-dependent peptidase